MTGDDKIDRIAARQHALVTARQLAEAGIDGAARRHRVRSGRLVRERWDVFRISGAPRSREQSILAAVLAFGPGAVASHTTAAELWRFPNVQHERIELTSSRPHRIRLAGVRSHRTVAFLAEEHTVLDRIPLTTVARTLVDLSSLLSVAQLGVITDDALRRGTLSLRELQRSVAGIPGGPGRKPSRIRSVLAQRIERYDPGDSGLELRVLRAIVAAGLPEPVQQHEVLVAGRRYRIDLAYPEHGLAIEIDGFDPHRFRSAFDRDRARANDLVVAGWTVLRFTSESTDVQVGTTVAAALTRLGHEVAL
jgi:uncharacterized protein DUF559